jgi:hypothetical protein
MSNSQLLTNGQSQTALGLRWELGIGNWELPRCRRWGLVID